MPRFFKWDYGNRIVIEYTRAGECNSCGECCRAMIRFKTTMEHPRAGANGTDAIGIWSEYRDEERRKFFNVYEITPNQPKCVALTENNQCAEHYRKELICSGFPFAPEHVTPFPGCSYTFAELERWEF